VIFKTSAVSIVLALALAGSAVPQQTSTVQRDPRAIATLQAAVDAMGGSKAFAQLQAAIVQGSIKPAPGVNSPPGNVVLEDAFTSQGHEFRDSFQSGSLTQVFVSGHGSPGLVSNAHSKKFLPAAAGARLAVHLPGIVLLEIIANANYSMAFVGSTSVNGLSALHVHIEDDSDPDRQTLSVQDWYFDPSSGLPLRVEYRVPDTTNASMFTNVAVQLSDFRVVQGITAPFQIAGYVEGKPQNLLLIGSVVFNHTVSSSDFDLPPGGAQ